MKTNLFFGCKTSDEVRNRYDELSHVFKPQTNGESNEMMNSINDEYDKLMMVLGESKPLEAAKEKATVPEKIEELRAKVNPEGLHMEIIKNWLWISGKTFQVKDTLKELGFRYSPNKRCFYYRQSNHRSGNQEPLAFETIRELYKGVLCSLFFEFKNSGNIF
jgi:hypothetical protein